MFRGNPRTAVATGQEGLRRIEWRTAHGNLPKGRTAVYLDDTGLIDGSTNRDETGPGVINHPPSQKTICSVAGDQRHMCQGLGVVHQCRAPTDAQWRSFVWTKDRQRLPIVDPVDQC